MTHEPTCGEGLAEHAALPAKRGELIACTAANLEVHSKTLDLADEHARQEHAAYAKLAEEHRRIAARLRATAEEMAGHRDLPMGRHDVEALSSPEVVKAFEDLVDAEQELVGLLRERIDQHRKMLAEIGGGD